MAAPTPVVTIVEAKVELAHAMFQAMRVGVTWDQCRNLWAEAFEVRKLVLARQDMGLVPFEGSEP